MLSQYLSDIDIQKRIDANWMTCCRCKFNGWLRFFTKSDQKRRYPYCIDCRNESREKSRIKAREKWLREEYNITLEQYEIILNNQKRKCAICKMEETHVNYISKKRILFAVDHNHSRGNVRGLLCRKCNLMIGNSRDSIKILRAAIRYLKQSDSQLLAKDIEPKELTV